MLCVILKLSDYTALVINMRTSKLNTNNWSLFAVFMSRVFYLIPQFENIIRTQLIMEDLRTKINKIDKDKLISTNIQTCV